MSDSWRRFRQAQREYERELALGGEPPQVGVGEGDSGVPPVPPGADTPARYRLFVNDERTVLMRIWKDVAVADVARRESPEHTWGPPVYLFEVPA